MPRTGRPRTKALVARVPERYQAFVTGELSVEDLDDEEVFRGQIRNKNGTFSGTPPKAIPREFHQALVRELVTRMEQRFAQHVDLGYKTLVEIAANPRASADARYKSATYLIERVMGKIPEKQIVSATISKWEQDVEGLFVDVARPGFEEGIVDAEIVED
jgi:hypothetical protein